MKRINKGTARRLFNKGNNVYCIPCKLNFGVPWHSEILINRSGDGDENSSDFDRKVNALEFFNCSSCTGKYLHFYVK